MGDAIKNKLRRIRTGLRFGSSPIEFDAHVFNFDNRNAKMTFQIVDEDDEPVPLVDVRAITIPLAFVTGNRFNCDDILHVNALEAGRIVNGAQGVFEWEIPVNQLNHTGQILGEIAIEFNDGSSLVPTQFMMSSTKALITKPLPAGVVEFYIRMFDELRDYILQRQAELEQLIANNEQANNQNQTELEARMTANEERLEQHTQDVNDVGIVMQGQFEELYQEVQGMATERVEGNLSWITVDESRAGKLDDIKLSGMTFNNLWSGDGGDFHQIDIFPRIQLDGNLVTGVATSAGGQWGMNVSLRTIMLKANTTYTYIIDVVETNEGMLFALGAPDMGGTFMVSTLGRHITVRTMPTNLQPGLGGFFNNTSLIPNNRMSIRITIIEGDVRELIENHTPPRALIPSKPSMMRTVGENLFDGVWQEGGLNPNGTQNSNTDYIRSGFIEVEGGRTVHQTNLGVGGSRNDLLEFDSESRFLRWTSSNVVTLQQETRYIRIRRGNNATPADINTFLSAVAYDREIPATTPHISQFSAIEVLKDGEWQMTPLRSIQNGAQTLVADTIESDGQGGLVMVQRVEHLKTFPTGGNLWAAPQVEGFATFQIAFTQRWLGVDSLSVNSNLLATLPLAQQGMHRPYVLLSNNAQSLQIRLSEADSGLTQTSGLGALINYLNNNGYEFLMPLRNPITYPVRPINLDSFEPTTHVQITSESPVNPRTSFKIATSLSQRLQVLTRRVANLEAWSNEFKSEFDLALANLSAEMLRAEDMILPTNHFHADIPISNYPLGPSGMRIESNTLNWPHAGLRVETFRYADNAGVQRATTMANIEFRRIASNNVWGQWTPMPTQAEIDALVAEIAKLKANNENSRTARKTFGDYVNQELADVKSMTKAFGLVLNNQNQEVEKLVSKLNEQNQDLDKLASENKRLTKLVDYLCSELGIEEIK